MQSFQKTSSKASRYQSFNEANRSTWMPSTLLNSRARLSLKHSLLHFRGLPLGLRWLTYAIRTCLGGAETCPRRTFPRYWRARMSIIVWIVGMLQNRSHNCSLVIRCSFTSHIVSFKMRRICKLMALCSLFKWYLHTAHDSHPQRRKLMGSAMKTIAFDWRRTSFLSKKTFRPPTDLMNAAICISMFCHRKEWRKSTSPSIWSTCSKWFDLHQRTLEAFRYYIRKFVLRVYVFSFFVSRVVFLHSCRQLGYVILRYYVILGYIIGE